MRTTLTTRALLIAVESERTAEAFVEAAREMLHIHESDRRRKFLRAARVLREQAEAIRLSAEPANGLRTYGKGKSYNTLTPFARSVADKLLAAIRA